MAGFDIGEATNDQDRSVEDELDKKSNEAFHFFENNLIHYENQSSSFKKSTRFLKR